MPRSRAVGEPPSPAAALAGSQDLGPEPGHLRTELLHLGVRVPLGSLVDDAATQRGQLDEAIHEQDGVADVVGKLEALYDEGDEVASGEEIAAEIERFLRETGTEES